MNDFTGPLTIFEPSDILAVFTGFLILYFGFAGWTIYAYVRARENR